MVVSVVCRLVEAQLRRGEILFLWENGGQDVPPKNIRATARFLMRKYPGVYISLDSARKSVGKILKNIKNKWDVDSSKNPLRDGRTTAKKPLRVRNKQQIRDAVEDTIGTCTSRELARGTCVDP